MKPTIKISAPIHLMIESFHKWDWKNKEWSCIARLNKNLEVVDCHFPKQKNSMALTTMTDIQDILPSIIDKDIDNYHEYCVWMHSHNTMKCFWSGTDYEQMKSFHTDWWCKYMFHIVTSTWWWSNWPFNWVYYHCTLTIQRWNDIEKIDLPVIFDESSLFEPDPATVQDYLSALNDTSYLEWNEISYYISPEEVAAMTDQWTEADVKQELVRPMYSEYIDQKKKELKDKEEVTLPHYNWYYANNYTSWKGNGKKKKSDRYSAYGQIDDSDYNNWCRMNRESDDLDFDDDGLFRPYSNWFWYNWTA